MATVGAFAWIVFLAWLVGCLHPSPELRRDAFGRRVYYLVWAGVFASVVLIHFYLLAHAGHAMLAWEHDSLGIGLGLLWLVTVYWPQRAHHA